MRRGGEATLAAKHEKAESDGGTISAKLLSIKIHAAEAEVHAAIHHDLGPLPPELVAKHEKQIDATAAGSKPHVFNGPLPGPIDMAAQRHVNLFVYFVLLFPFLPAVKIAAETKRYAAED